MIELNDQRSFQVLGAELAAAQRPQAMVVGKVFLTGELVDTKCYLGVMRPAVGKVHRACAVRCLSGGVPPEILVKDQAGNQIAVPLVGANGGLLSVDPQWAARILTVEGILEIVDGLTWLKAGAIRFHRDQARGGAVRWNVFAGWSSADRVNANGAFGVEEEVCSAGNFPETSLRGPCPVAMVTRRAGPIDEPTGRV